MDKLANIYENYRNELFFLGALLMALLLPIQKMSTTIAFVILGLGFLIGKKEIKLTNSSRSYVLLTLFIYYVSLAVSTAFSSYYTYGLNDLQIKAPLLVLPLLFSFIPALSEAKRKKIWLTFLFSSTIIAAFLLLRVLYFWMVANLLISNVSLVAYTIIHPSYLASYLMLALMAVWLLPSRLNIDFPVYLKVALTFILSLAILFLASRLIIILNVFFLLYLILTRLKLSYAVGLSTFIILLVSLSIWKIPILQERFEKAKNMFTQSASAVNQYTVDDRLMTWKNAKELIIEKPMWGYTNGDYCYHYLKEKHNQSGFGKGYRQKLNAHNQLIESQLSMGVWGSFLFLGLFVIAFWLAITSKHRLFLAFLLLSFSFAMVESIFQSQGGVMFFGFFLGLFLNETKHISR